MLFGPTGLLDGRRNGTGRGGAPARSRRQGRLTMLYRGMDRVALDAAYNNTAAVGQAARDRYVADWATRSDRLRKARGGSIDVRYGAGPRQRLDVFDCGMPPAPTPLYLHRGHLPTD